MSKWNLGEYDEFIGLYKKAVDPKICSQLVNWFEIAHEQKLTMTAQEDGNILSATQRKDTVLHIPSYLSRNCLPISMIQPLWTILINCLKEYKKEYSYTHRLVSDAWKIHSVKPGGGYHIWHHEQTAFTPYRVMAWLIILQAPKEGGETEFLLHSKRYDPVVGNILIWPGSWTHKHRGNPPLKGEKVYATGWFETQEKIGDGTDVY